MHVLMVAAVLGQAAHAEDSEFEGTDEAGQLFEETETRLSVELGGAVGAGTARLRRGLEIFRCRL